MLKKVREPCFAHDDLISVFASGSRGSDEGTFDCDTVIQSVTILGVENKPSTVVVHASGEGLRHYRNVGLWSLTFTSMVVTSHMGPSRSKATLASITTNIKKIFLLLEIHYKEAGKRMTGEGKGFIFLFSESKPKQNIFSFYHQMLKTPLLLFNTRRPAAC